MTIDIERIKSAIISTISDNKELIGSVIGTTLLYKCCKKFDIPISNTFGFGNSFSNRATVNAPNLKIQIVAPATALQSAIYSIYKNAIGMSSDYYKCAECEKIANIIENSGDKADDAAKSYAIEAISAIQDTISSSYYRGECTDYINAILGF